MSHKILNQIWKTSVTLDNMGAPSKNLAKDLFQGSNFAPSKAPHKPRGMVVAEYKVAR